MRKERIKNHTFRDEIHSFLLRRRIRNMDFSIIASNCWGSRIYQELKIPYNTPFAGLFFYAPCYIRLLSNLETALGAELKFAEKSRYVSKSRGSNERPYPIGILNDDIEIHFQHYKTAEDAGEKWNRRLKRMNMNRLFFSFTDRDCCDESLLRTFDRLPFNKKVCFTAKPYPDLESAVYLPAYQNDAQVGDLYTLHRSYKGQFDVADWLNGGAGRPVSRTYKFFTRILLVP